MILSENMKRLAFLAGIPIPAQIINEVTLTDYASAKVRGLNVEEVLPALQKAYDGLPPDLKSRMGFDEFVKHAMEGMEQGAAEEVAHMMQQAGSVERQATPPPPAVEPEVRQPLTLQPRAQDMSLVPKADTRRRVPPKRKDTFFRFLNRQVGRVAKMTGPGRGV